MSSTTQIKVYFFAKSKELAGLNETRMDLDISTLSGNELLDIIINKYPK